MKETLMAVIVKLTYETRQGESIPLPDNYPDEIRLPDMSSPQELTDDMVTVMIKADLLACGAKELDVVICWTANVDKHAPT